MNFAVVEYSSKSGDIWFGKPDHPNYLEDPTKVIDPTSFGCYVSALNGQHIPLDKFAGKHSFWRRAAKKITGSWPANYSLGYFQQFDTLMVVHQLSNAHEILAFAKRIKKLYPGIFLLGVPTQPYGLLRQHLDNDSAARQHFINFMDACDLFLSVVDATVDWYQAQTNTPVVYLPQIYPAHFASQNFLPASKKDKTIFAAGITNRPNINQGFTVAKELQKKFPDYLIKITQIPGVDLDLSQLKTAKYETIPFQQWREHLPWLAKQKLVINTDYTQTRGRVQVDCAAVGTPSLGGNSDGETDLFPDLASSPATSLDNLIARGERLLTDQIYYQEITDTAFQKLQKYDYEESAARLKMLVKSHRHEQRE